MTYFDVHIICRVILPCSKSVMVDPKHQSDRFTHRYVQFTLVVNLNPTQLMSYVIMCSCLSKVEPGLSYLQRGSCKVSCQRHGYLYLRYFRGNHIFLSFLRCIHSLLLPHYIHMNKDVSNDNSSKHKLFHRRYVICLFIPSNCMNP